jgi:hypothetical protein
MTLSDEQLNSIAEYSALFLPPAEIAVLIDVNIDDLCAEISNKESKASKAYFKAKYIQQAEIRKQIIKLAKHGSPQAEDMVIRFIASQNSHEIDM